jgi:hypothetical protein
MRRTSDVLVNIQAVAPESMASAAWAARTSGERRRASPAPRVSEFPGRRAKACSSELDSNRREEPTEGLVGGIARGELSGHPGVGDLATWYGNKVRETGTKERITCGYQEDYRCGA